MADGEAPGCDALQRWLAGPEVVTSSGVVHAWAPDGHPYPEAGGLWLSWIAACDPEHPHAPAVATWLRAAIDRDAVGRGGAAYTFDLGVALTGVLRWSRAQSRSPCATVRLGAQRLVDAIAARRSITAGTAPPRWSTVFGPHQAKLAVALAEIDRARVVDTSVSWATLRSMLEVDFIDAAQYGTESVYVHAAAYAVEGAWCMGDTDTLLRTAVWLAAIQRNDGGICAWWHPERGGHGPGRADATAQAVRLWCAADAERHRHSIERALGFVASLQQQPGGVRYDESSAHRNVWCSLFVWQARQFATHGARREALL